MKRLTVSQVIMLHDELIRSTGGTPGMRELPLLEAAVAAPFQSFADVEVFPSILQKAARLGMGITNNHPFVDGNKRTGAHAMLVFLSSITFPYPILKMS